MIEIKVTGSTPLEALSTVTAFGMRCMISKDVREAADKILAAEQHKNDNGVVFDKAADSQTFGNLNPAPTAVVPTPSVPVTTAPAPAPAPNVPQAPVVSPVAPAAPINNTVPVAPTAPAPSLTLEQVGKAGADLIAANPTKMQELLALLGQFGVQAITELKPEQVGPFATALRGLGGKI